jgi:O-antigen ligase
VSTKTTATKQPNQSDGIIKKVIIFSVIISLYFNVNLQDPFNSPKMWILMALAGWLLIYLTPIQSIKTYGFSYLYKNKARFLVILFLLSLFLSAVLTEVKFTAFFGTEGRRLGFLTYLSLSVIFLGFVKFYSYNKFKIYLPVLVLSFTFVAYGYLQGSGQDFISWNNPYNSIILTFGNPNYSSAMLSILTVVLVGASFDKSLKTPLRILCILLSLSMLLIIRNSDSRQGLVAFFIAVLVQICFKLYFKSRWAGQIAVGVSGVAFTLVTLAMLQIGPLVELVYKKSVSIRGYYWRAAIEMFKDYPLFGVGVDRYGEYFKEYRETSYSLEYGFEITSSNAHSVPLQLLATGGIFVGLFYLTLVLYIFYAGVKAILLVETAHRSHLIAVFSGWVAFQAQSIISIDNIGLTIWGWIFGGIIVATYQKLSKTELAAQETHRSDNSLSKSLVRQLKSYVIIFLIIVLCSFPYRGETLALKNRTVYNPAIESNRTMIKTYGDQMQELKLIEPNHRFWSANYLITSGFEDIGFKVLDRLMESDPRNLNYLNAKAGYLEQRKQYGEAIKLRIEIEKFDQWNARNILILGQNYKAVGNYSAAKQAWTRLMSFASNHPIAEESRVLLTNG